VAKVKRNKKVNNIKKVAATKVDNKLSLLLIVLALLLFALVAIYISGSASQSTVMTPAKVTVTQTAKPVVKATVKPTVKPATTVKK
jgi:uncharacterized protein YneF (UPF0154 family)